jgi:hypothetical protein
MQPLAIFDIIRYLSSLQPTTFSDPSNYRIFSHNTPPKSPYILFCLQLSLIYGIIKLSGEEKYLAIRPNPKGSFLSERYACSR